MYIPANGAIAVPFTYQKVKTTSMEYCSISQDHFYEILQYKVFSSPGGYLIDQIHLKM